MKILAIIVFSVLTILLMLYAFLMFNDNKKLKRENELMQTQFQMLNKLTQQNAIQLDQQSINAADYVIEENNTKTLIYYSKMKNVQDYSITIDAQNKIKYWGEYKP